MSWGSWFPLPQGLAEVSVAWQFYSWADGRLESFVSSYQRADRVDETIARYGYTDYTGNLIGWRYQPLRAEQPAGTQASPRLHWRRGHIRRQAHGLGRAERKLIWIEPMLIGMRQAQP